MVLVLVLTDTYSKMSWVYIISDKSATTILTALKMFAARVGVPTTLRTDRVNSLPLSVLRVVG